MYRNLPILLMLFLAAGALCASSVRAERAVSLTTLEGETMEAELLELGNDSIVVRRDGETVSMALSKLLRIESQDKKKPTETTGRELKLIDESTLPVNEVIVEDRTAKLLSNVVSGDLAISADVISMFYLRPPLPEAVTYVEGILQQGLTGDAIVVQKGEPPQFDHLSGVLGDVDAEAVRFNWDGEEIVVKRKKLAAVIYYHPEDAESGEPRFWVETSSGARLNAESFTLKENSDRFTVRLQCGIELTIPASDLRTIDLSAGKLVYLSDLKPLRQKWVPLVGLPETGSLSSYGLPRNDQSFTGSPLSLRWQSESSSNGEMRYYRKGLALRSRTEIAYKIPRGIKSFQASAGIDPMTAEEGHVRLEISADKTILWEGEISGKQAPTEINLQLPKARRLRFVVDYGENRDYGDRLHLVEARMTK